MKCPCKDCEKAGCGPYHDQFQQYSLWRAWRQKLNVQMAIERKKSEISKDHEKQYRYNLKKGWNKP